MHTATYSPEDDKLRIYPFNRLPEDEYRALKAAGYSWAPKQECFYAVWSIVREDAALDLCGEIGDEDKTLAERAEERAERFEEYSANRANDADAAHAAAQEMAGRFEAGQPILIGHHSEKRARKDKERIDNAMRKAVNAWETSEYWTHRAARAIKHAQYKERPDVRQRRIKTIEADKRKQQRMLAEAENTLRLFLLIDDDSKWKIGEDGTRPDRMRRARYVANRVRLHVTKETTDGKNDGTWTAYDVLQPDEDRYSRCPAKTPDDCIAAAQKNAEVYRKHCGRWIAHYDNRLAYERAMLAECGGGVSDRKPLEVGGAVQCLWAPRGGWAYIKKVNKVTVTVLHQWNDGGRVFRHNEALDKLTAIMTRAEVEAARAEGRIKEAPENMGFWLLQSREEFDESEKSKEQAKTKPEPQATPEGIAAMREQLKNGGAQIAVADQLFPTPPDIARRMVEVADIRSGMPVLEPSGGTGNIIREIDRAVDTEIVSYEINRELCAALTREFPCYRLQVRCCDFLTVTEGRGFFERVLMNPPFRNGEDIQHIQHAATFLRPGGVMVALCANGPRQNDALKQWAIDSGGSWEPLPAGSFSKSGTMVNVAMLVYHAPKNAESERQSETECLA